MKKAVSILLVGMLILAMGASSAFAQTASQGVNFVDENKDGMRTMADTDQRRV